MDPGALGLDVAKLNQATTELHSAAAVRNCTLIVKSGYIVHEFYDGGSNAESTFESDSMGKATSAVLIGLLEYRGLVDLDTPIINYNVTSTQCSPPTTCPTWNSTGVDYFPNVTLRHVLSQATGYGRVQPGSFFTCETTMELRPMIPCLSCVMLCAVRRYQRSLSLLVFRRLRRLHPVSFLRDRCGHRRAAGGLGDARAGRATGNPLDLPLR